MRGLDVSFPTDTHPHSPGGHVIPRTACPTISILTAAVDGRLGLSPSTPTEAPAGVMPACGRSSAMAEQYRLPSTRHPYSLSLGIVVCWEAPRNTDVVVDYDHTYAAPGDNLP